jgi:hypothetical protein
LEKSATHHETLSEHECVHGLALRFAIDKEDEGAETGEQKAVQCAEPRTAWNVDPSTEHTEKEKVTVIKIKNRLLTRTMRLEQSQKK